MITLTPKQKETMHKLGYEDTTDFLTHYPTRYETLYPKPINEWQVGELVIFYGPMATPFKTAYYNKRSRTAFSVNYQDHIVTVSMFNQPYYKTQNYRDYIVVVGIVQDNGSVVVRNITNQNIELVSGIQPIYSTKVDISQKMIRTIMKKTLDNTPIANIIPESFIKQYRLMQRQDALQAIHFPKTHNELEAAIRTLKYEEFLVYHVYNALNAKDLSVGINRNVANIETYLEKLPFDLTRDQSMALDEILGDLNTSKQVHRLLQGDVGSGKTIVALLAAMAMIDKSYQVAFMVPTDILVQQHAGVVATLFPNIRVATITAESENKNDIIEGLKEGSIDLVIATHALIQDYISFKNLGLVIIDEQHRFGVDQRQALINKGTYVDVLMLSATPIPRSLAASLYFDVDISEIKGYPSHRKETKTFYIKENSIRSILDDLYARLDQQDQVYIVCAAINEGERSGVRNVHAIYKQANLLFSKYGVGMVHGQMDYETRSQVMENFSNGTLRVLVCTTIIEVGIDIHKANTMVIYNAEMFGIATLHQLRGRIGRGESAGLCYLLSSNESEDTRARLEVLASTTDGFKLSLHDLRQRGMGDILGKRQSGLPHFLLGSIEEDQKIVNVAKKDARYIVDNKDTADFEVIVNISKNKSLGYN